MKTVTLGNTGIIANKNGFGALPIQRVSFEEAADIIHLAYDNGVNFYDTARSYSDSESKLGEAFKGVPRDSYYIATKTPATTGEQVMKDLETSLNELRTDYIDIYQLHCAQKCYRPGEEDGVYDALLRAKQQGKIRHIGITAHLLTVAREAIDSGLYATLQYPFSYISQKQEIELVKHCIEQGMGFLGMKGLAGGLLTNAAACYWFADQYDGVLPLWGVQKKEEMQQFIDLQKNPPALTEDLKALMDKDKEELSGSFCRGCGYCMPCPQDIKISNCARMSQMIRRAPSKNWLSEEWQANMKQIETCLHCGKCSEKCPYGLDTPALLEANYEDYQNILAGKVQV